MKNFFGRTKGRRWRLTRLALGIVGVWLVVNCSVVCAAPLTVEQLRMKWTNSSPAELHKLAEAGNAEAQYLFGLHEWIEARNQSSQGYEFSQQAVSGGGNLLETEKQAAQSKWGKAAETDLQAAARRGDRQALWFLADRHYERASARATNAFAWMKRAAEQSLPCAEWAVALRYLGEIGWSVVRIDSREGITWMQRAADHGYIEAAHRMADYLLKGNIVPSDIPKGIEYLRRVADTGDGGAQFQLAECYAVGNGEPRGDGDTTVALLRKSADSGYRRAQFALAERYRNGLGVAKDYLLAVRYYEAAAKAKNQDDDRFWTRSSIRDLIDGDLRPKSPLTLDYVKFAEVLSIYLRATQLQDAEAMSRLGEVYLAGKMTAQNKVEAYRWLNQSVQRGNKLAVVKRDDLQRKLSKGELEQAATKSSKP